MLDEWERRGKANKISEKIISPQIVTFPDTHEPFVSDDLVRLMREIGREDAATSLIGGCPMYRIGREDDDFFQLEKSITGNDDEAR